MKTLVALLALSTPCLAQGIDMSKGGPIEVTARGGIEWRQNEQEVVAQGDARATRGDSSVVADTLIAHYRKKAAPEGAPAPAAPAPGVNGGLAPSDTGSNEIYRLEADGNVKLFNATDIAVGSHAIYDIDRAVLLLTGKDLKLTTPTDVMTARDTMEYYSQKHMAIGRGLATVTTSDGRRLAADVLVAYTAPPPGSPSSAPRAQQVAARPGADPLSSGGKIQRVEAFGHVEVRTATDTVTGDRGVYVADSQIARVAGHVHITRGLNQLNGDEALINMATGVSTLVRDPGQRVQGLIVPNDPSSHGALDSPKPSPAPGPQKK